MEDYIVRATAANDQIRVFACYSKAAVELAREYHNTSPVATAALGRLLSAGAMMGTMMKNEKDLITLSVRGDGPIGAITVTANYKGEVKGYVNNPNVIIPANSIGKLDVSGAIGAGSLHVIRDTGLKDPYIGQVELVSGELAEDLTYYFAASEQVPSSVGLGVLMDRDNHVKHAGGFIIQLMPFTEDSVIDALEAKLSSLKSVTTMFDSGMSPEDIITDMLGDLGDIEFTDRMPLTYKCNCSKERISKAIISIGRKDIQEMIDDGKSIEVNCQFCNKSYELTIDELKELLISAT